MEGEYLCNIPLLFIRTLESDLKPIIFNTEMVKAIIAGNKQQTRRPIKKISKDINIIQEYSPQEKGTYACYIKEKYGQECFINAPYKEGETMYVRETFCRFPEEPIRKIYRIAAITIATKEKIRILFFISFFPSVK